MGALIGKKLGMTQVYNDKEELVPVTVVAAGPCPVVQVRSQDDNGYDALQLAFEEIPARKVNKPETGHFSKAGVGPHRVLREFRKIEGDFEVGQVDEICSLHHYLNGALGFEVNWIESAKSLLIDLEGPFRYALSRDKSWWYQRLGGEG